MRLTRLVLALALSAVAASPAGAENWMQFRGPSSSGVASDTNLPVRWSRVQGIAWKVKVAGLGWAQPVVWGNKIFVTTVEADKQARPRLGDWDPSPGVSPLLRMIGASKSKPPDVLHRWKVLCFDVASGKILWEQLARQGKPTFPIHPSNTYATETPVVDGERLIAYFGMTGIYCYDLSGKLLWNKDLASYPTQMDWGSGSSLAHFGDLVYVQCDNDKESFL